jgi:two-component system, NtrC family, sensor kinase
MRRTSDASPVVRAWLSRVVGRSWLVVSMLASIGLVLAVAAWSAARARAESLADFSAHQALLAAAVAGDFEQRLSVRDRSATGAPLSVGDEALLDLLGGVKRIESSRDRIVLVARPEASGFLTTDRRIIPSSRLRSAIDMGERSVVIPRDEAATFGLPRRTAIAGLARVSTHERGEWGLVVLASAERLRDRQILEERRLAATVVIVTIVVGAFGVIARRRQRGELELERRIAVSALEREREAALARADKMAALAALSTGIAHEVGTPLGVIVGRVEQVLDRVDDQRSTASLGVVLEQVERIRHIVRGCLALARGDAPELVRTPPESLARRATDLVRHRFAKAEVELECVVDADLPSVACEPALFEQALVNVLLNACEATPRGGRVRLAVTSKDAQVRFVVEDDGAGISEAIARRATEPFFSTRLAEGGSGLGLTIANEIVNHHDGRLFVEKRTTGRGTRATITIRT